MLNKNLFILLFTVVFVVSFAKNKPESDLLERAQEIGVSGDQVQVKEPEIGALQGVQEEQGKASVEKVSEENAQELVKEIEKEKPVKAEIAKKPIKKKTETKKEVAKRQVAEKKLEKKVAQKQEEKPEEKKPEIFLIDKIETVIYGPEETSIITKTDLERIGLDGQKRTKDKMTFELLVFQDAKKYGISDEKLVDKYIEAIQAQQNLSLPAIKKMFADFGYTYEEGREQLGMYNTISQLMDYKVRSKVIIPEKEVREYYDANPAYLEEAYNLQRIFVPVKGDTGTDVAGKGLQAGDKASAAGGKGAEIEKNNLKQASQEQTGSEKINLEKIKLDIESKLRAGQVIEGAEYSENFWVEKPELADDKLFISNMSVGSVSVPVFIDGAGEAGSGQAAASVAGATERGFESFKLVERRERQLASFEQRYREITDLLREPLYNKLFDEYKESLFKESVIVDL